MGGTRRPRRLAARETARGLALLVVLTLLVACGEDGADRPSTASTTEDPSLRPPGTELGDGLVVPDGAHLAGSVFGDTSPAVNDPGWSALLTVDDDPFAVFDDVSAQLRDLGVPMPGTGASCLWQGRDDVGNDFAPLQAVAAGDPGGAITALDCAAIANHGPDAAPGRPTGASMALRWDEETTGALWLTWSIAPSDRGPMSFGNASGGDPPVGPPPSAGDQPGRAPAGPDAVPSGSRDLLPPRAPAEHPSTGDPFGGETNCHSTGYERFTLPDGARLVATAAGPDGRSVLAVDGVEATVDALTTQAGDSPDLSLDAAEATQPDGQEAARRVILITAGGGACELLASADEEHLLMTGHSD